MLALLLMVATAVPAHADVTLLLEQPINFLGRVTASGHAAIWLDTICSDELVTLCPCREAERGTVLSRYSGAAGHDWLAVPPYAYLYAVDSASTMPEHVNRRNLARQRTRYRRDHPGPIEK